MAKIRIAIAAALMLCVFIPVTAAQAAATRCSNTLAQYSEALPKISMLLAEANAKADANPLYISDVAYYESVMRDTQMCIRTLAPMTTASR